MPPWRLNFVEVRSGSAAGPASRVPPRRWRGSKASYRLRGSSSSACPPLARSSRSEVHNLDPLPLLRLTHLCRLSHRLLASQRALAPDQPLHCARVVRSARLHNRSSRALGCVSVLLPLPYRYCSVLVTFSIPGGDGYGAASNADANLDLLVQPRVVGRSVLPSGCSRMYMDLGAHMGELPRAPDLSSRAFHSMRSIHICVLSLRSQLSSALRARGERSDVSVLSRSSFSKEPASNELDMT